MRQINLQLSNRAIYTLVAMMLVVLVGAGILVVNAYGGSSPSVVGHSAGELEGVCKSDGSGCPGFIPSGSVMAFDLASCPSGWTEYTTARDRVIIGSGSSYSRGATGGEATHTLTVTEMPSHYHTTTINPGSGYERQGATPVLGGQAFSGNSFNTDSKGSNQAHNNMQPYIALLFCKKN